MAEEQATEDEGWGIGSFIEGVFSSLFSLAFWGAIFGAAGYGVYSLMSRKEGQGSDRKPEVKVAGTTNQDTTKVAAQGMRDTPPVVQIIPVAFHSGGGVSQETMANGTDARRLSASLAQAFLGIQESNDNTGAIVELVGRSGQPWCGGFVDYVYDRTMPGLFIQPDPLRAKSFADHANQYGAFRPAGSGHIPVVGDTAVFHRGKGGGHVGIVTSVNQEKGTYTIVSGNDKNMVRKREITLEDDGSRILGFVDVTALARAKGVSLQLASIPDPVSRSISIASSLRTHVAGRAPEAPSQTFGT